MSLCSSALARAGAHLVCRHIVPQHLLAGRHHCLSHARCAGPLLGSLLLCQRLECGRRNAQVDGRGAAAGRKDAMQGSNVCLAWGVW